MKSLKHGVGNAESTSVKTSSISVLLECWGNVLVGSINFLPYYDEYILCFVLLMQRVIFAMLNSCSSSMF